MLLTNQQKFLLDVLERLGCVRENQLVSLIRPVFFRRRPDMASAVVAASMRQLMRGNFGVRKDGDVFLRRVAKPNPALLEALDVMLELSSDAPSSYRTGTPPAILRFCVQEGKSLAAFLVARYGDDPSRMGMAPEERLILLFDGQGRPTPCPFQISNFSPSGWKPGNTGSLPWTAHRRKEIMARKNPFDEMEPDNMGAPESGLFPEAGAGDFPMTESLAPPAFLEQDAPDVPAVDSPNESESGAAWDADAPAPDWNDAEFPGASLDGDSESAFPPEEFPPLETGDSDASFLNPPPETFLDGGGMSEDGTPDLQFTESAEIPEDGTEIPYGEELGERDGAENEPQDENAVITRPRPRTVRDAPREPTPAEADRAAFFGLDFHGLDRDLTPEQRKEWNSIYASYRGGSVMSGRIVGVDRAQVQMRNPPTGIMETRRIYCAVVIPYRVRIIIPEMEMWRQGEERPGFVLRNTPGASADFVIIRVDRENNLAVASCRKALASRRYYFSTQPSMNRPGSRIQCSVMAVGPRRCLVTCNGHDIDLTQRELSYSSVPDLTEAYHPGDVLDCVVKEYDSRADALTISVKETEPNPFDGAEFRHPSGCTREAVISGKYGGGVFCTLPDDVTVMCNYAFHYDDSTFEIGDRVLVQIQRYETPKKQVYGKIVAKW